MHMRNLLYKFARSLKRFLKRKNRQSDFKIEIELIKGTHQNENEHPSIIHFSFDKAATQYVRSILRCCAVENGLVPVRLQEYAFNTDFPYLTSLSAKEMENYKHIFKEKGYLYSVLAGMIKGMPNLDKYKVVLVVRDPRDILVSSYYSTAYSHSVPDGIGDKRENFLKIREGARNSTIDDYVISRSDGVLKIFLRYKNLLLNNYPHVYLTKYEEMAENFDDWLNSLLNYCQLNISEDIIKELTEENDRIRPREENIYRHLRKGQPGDYKEKLKPETICHLNAKFSSILADFNYR